MTKEMKIEILMDDRCTKSEAEDYLRKGTTIFEDFEENCESYLDGWSVDEEEREDYRKMIKEKSPIMDWGIVEKNGKTYYIAYVI